MELNLIDSITKEYLVIFFFLAFGTSFLELFYQECLGKNMIFQYWGLYLKELYDRNGYKRKISMILGQCRYCNGFWLSVIIYLIYFKSFSLSIMLFASFVYMIIKIISVKILAPNL